MSKKEFLKKLKKALNDLPREERNKTIEYYSELIADRVEDGTSEEEAVAAMGSIDEICGNIRQDAEEKGVKLKKSGGAVKKVLILILAVLLAAGLLLGSVPLLVNVFGVDFSFITGEWKEVNAEYSVPADKQIQLDMNLMDLELGISPDDKVHVKYYENKVIDYSVKETSAGLDVIQKVKFWGAPLINTRDKSTVVLVPEGFSGSLVTKLTSGDTTIQGLTALTKLSVKTTSGDIVVENAGASSELKIEATSGRISADKLSAGKGSIAATSGDITLSSASFDGDLDIGCTSGNIDVARIVCAGLRVKATSGSIDIKNAESASVETKLTSGRTSLTSVTTGTLRVGGTSGSVTLNEVDAKDIDISTTSGNISGTLTGSSSDYRIESSATSGRNNLPNGWGDGERTLKVKVTSGNISIEFTGGY